MKIKKVGKICTSAGRFYITEEKEDGYIIRQWLGDACAMYPLDGLPVMEPENICAMFDVPEKKRSKVTLKKSPAPTTINLGDTDLGEKEAADMKIRIRYKGMELAALRSPTGVTLIQAAYLTPLEGLEYLGYYERTMTSAAGGRYIVAKDGMMVQAVIMPVEIKEDFADELAELVSLCRRELEKKRFAARRPESFGVDEETGEVLGPVGMG